MSSDLLLSVFGNIGSVLLVILFFGGSILVHELGHFWAARRRGVYVERFSIGFGPKIVSWRGKDGVEYRLSWLPLGGYVALPQLADMSAIEGEAGAEAAKLPPPSYATKMIVFVAGAVMNMLFALFLASIIWAVGQPVSNEMSTTRIGYVSPTIDLSDGTKVQSPASKAGLRPGDTILAIDGSPVSDWIGVMYTLMTSSGRSDNGKPRSVFTLERDGSRLDVTLFPQLAGAEKDRRVGILPGYEISVHGVTAGSVAERAGFKPGDRILSVEGVRIHNITTYVELMDKRSKEGVTVRVARAGGELDLRLAPTADAKTGHGLTLTSGFRIAHPSPFKQVWEQLQMSYRTLGSLISPRSDVGLSKVSGPVGIVRIFYSAAEAGIIAILTFTILVNVSLAVFNLLPIPVLDGGHMLLATIARLRGRPLPMEFVAKTQTVFLLLLLTMIVYVSVFDVRRIFRDNTAAPKAPAAEKAQENRESEKAGNRETPAQAQPKPTP
jgi:regulator of sigma E protease